MLGDERLHEKRGQSRSFLAVEKLMARYYTFNISSIHYEAHKAYLHSLQLSGATVEIEATLCSEMWD